MEMIKSVLYLCVPLDRLIEMDWHNTVVKTHLQKLKILPKEWEVLSQLMKVLSVCWLILLSLPQLCLTLIFSSPAWKQCSDSPKRRSHFFTKSFPLLTSLLNDWMTSPVIEHTLHQYEQEPPWGLLCSTNTMWRWMNQSCTDVLWVHATYYPTSFSTILILIQLGSTSSQVQTGILLGKEMAWRLGWHGKSCIMRAMVNELQAEWSLRTCISGVWLVIVISELSLYL